jgi:hypothetical protein
MKLTIILLGLIGIVTVSNVEIKKVIVSTNNDYKLASNFYKDESGVKKNATNPDSTLPNYKKLAVLLGVDDYIYLRPASASVNNVNYLAANLKSHGYDTMVYLNLSQAQFMVTGMKEISAKQKTENYDVILFYISGHFDAIDEDQLFFLTADCNPNGDRNNYLMNGTIPLYNLLTKIRSMKAKVGMLLLDGPNDIELPGGSKGKQLINKFMNTTTSGMLLSSGIGDYNINNNNNKPTSLYSEAIINSLNTPELNLTQAFDNVNYYVKQKSGGKATAFYNNGISGNFCFSCK